MGLGFLSDLHLGRPQSSGGGLNKDESSRSYTNLTRGALRARVSRSKAQNSGTGRSKGKRPLAKHNQGIVWSLSDAARVLVKSA